MAVGNEACFVRRLRMDNIFLGGCPWRCHLQYLGKFHGSHLLDVRHEFIMVRFHRSISYCL